MQETPFFSLLELFAVSSDVTSHHVVGGVSVQELVAGSVWVNGGVLQLQLASVNVALLGFTPRPVILAFLR